jgi:glyoxylase-like metal-dependent hydrolase (beta-lactamase superfamily II)
MLEIVPLTLGPLQTNAYLLADPATHEAAVIDPAWDGHLILAEAARRSWRIAHIWYTHAHFDHIGGAAGVADGLKTPPTVALHPADYPLWRASGGAPLFGLDIDPGPEPTFDLAHGQTLYLGNNLIQVRHCPGHTRGHVLFYCPIDALAFVGDVIFLGSIGRTDLPGGDHDTLIESIRAQIMSLPDQVRLFSGHGSVTTVGRERVTNPYLLTEP